MSAAVVDAATIPEAVLARARACPQRTAVDDGGRRVTYGQLAAGLPASAAALRARAGAGARVGLLLGADATAMRLYLAAGLAGVTPVLLHTRAAARELADALALARPRLLVTTSAWTARARVAAPDGTTVCTPEDLDVRVPPAVGGPADGPGGPWLVGFTSGTSGRAKPFVRDHRSWLRSFTAAEDLLGIGPGDRVLVPGPLEHSLVGYTVVHTLLAGATAHLQGRFAPRAALALLGRAGITHLVLVPTMLRALLDAAASAPHEGVRTIVCSGARTHPGTADAMRAAFPRARLVDFYGASELSFVSGRTVSADDPPDLVGVPFDGVEVALRDADGAPVPDGGVGELWVRSPLLFAGYLDGDERGGAARRDADGWVSVGDLARRDAHGRLYLAGRTSALLNCGGLNVSPEEIEAVLHEVPGVAEAVVVGLPHPRWGDQLCAVVARDPGGPSRRRLREHCRARLGHGKRPQRWLEMAELPRTSGGKVARAAIAEGLRRGSLAVRELR